MDIAQILYFLGAILGGGIIGAIISSLATIFFGERRVETLRRRRDHSIKLNDGVLKPWLSKLQDYCKIGAIYNHEVTRIVENKPKDPTDLEFFTEAKSHLESNYPAVLKSWEELKQATLSHNEKIATVLEETRKSMVDDLKMPCYYWKLYDEGAPETCVMPDRILENFYRVIKWEVDFGKKWVNGKPSIEPIMSGNIRLYRLKWGTSEVVKSRDEEEVGKCLSLIVQLVEASKYRDEVKSLLKREDEMLQPKTEEFRKQITGLIKSIELGNIIKGKCKYCP